MLLSLLQDILHIPPALTQTAATAVQPADTMAASVHCGKTKVFMTNSVVSWSGDGEPISGRCTRSSTGQSDCSLGREGAEGLSRCPFLQLELLEHRRVQVLEQCARCIQRGWKRHQHRKQERRRQAAVCIQAGE